MEGPFSTDRSRTSLTHPHTHRPNQNQVSGGFNVGQVLGAYSCQTPMANAFDYEACPYELRVYADSIPGTTVGGFGLGGSGGWWLTRSVD